MDGVLNINKCKGMTSHDVVDEVRKIFNTRRVGHAGTLDPDAKGVLLVCIGRATKISQFLMSADKEYTGALTLGITTDTQDASGKPIKVTPVPALSRARLEETFRKFVGEQEQIPPMVSAIRYHGRKLYELAREGKEVKREPRRIEIFKLEILEYKTPEVRFRVTCSKGTYIRTLCADIGEDLGCGAHQSELTRSRSGSFLIEKAISLDDLRDIPHPEEVTIPMDEAISSFPAIKIKSPGFERTLGKNSLITCENLSELPGKLKMKEIVRVHNPSGRLLGMAKVVGENLRSEPLFGMIQNL